MSKTKLQNRLSTKFSHFVGVVGYPVHYLAHGVDLGFELMIVLALTLHAFGFGHLLEWHPSHEFELAFGCLVLANKVLETLLEKHDEAQEKNHPSQED